MEALRASIAQTEKEKGTLLKNGKAAKDKKNSGNKTKEVDRSIQERLKKVGYLSTVMSQNNDFSAILHYFT